jgi:hypothetical protein
MRRPTAIDAGPAHCSSRHRRSSATNSGPSAAVVVVAATPASRIGSWPFQRSEEVPWAGPHHRSGRTTSEACCARGGCCRRATTTPPDACPRRNCARSRTTRSTPRPAFSGNLWQMALRAEGEDALCLVELRGFEPLTPCMPSRDPDRSGPTKPRITRHATEAVVVTCGVWRGLVRLQLLPTCCPPNDHEHAPPPGPRRWRPLPCECESGVFLTVGRVAAAPAWRNRSKFHGGVPGAV